jgi:Raf kinase inhibitor-like YbhB/YbcL family protein
MRRIVLGLVLALACDSAVAQTSPPAPAMSLTSPAFEDGGILPAKYTQLAPAFVAPPVAWSNAPAGTVSFVLSARDGDTAPGKSTTDFLHWLAFNIPAGATGLAEGTPVQPQLGDGTVQIANGRGQPGWQGPGAQPPVYHHYIFELYALDTKLTLGPAASRAEVLAAMDGHVLGKAVLVARFHR